MEEGGSFYWKERATKTFHPKFDFHIFLLIAQYC